MFLQNRESNLLFINPSARQVWLNVSHFSSCSSLWLHFHLHRRNAVFVTGFYGDIEGRLYIIVFDHDLYTRLAAIIIIFVL